MPESSNVDHLIGRKLIPYFLTDNTENIDLQLNHEDTRDYNVDTLQARKFVDGVFVNPNPVTSRQSSSTQATPQRQSRKQRTQTTNIINTTHKHNNNSQSNSNITTPISTPQKLHHPHSSRHKPIPSSIQSAQYAAASFTASPAPDLIPMPKFLHTHTPHNSTTKNSFNTANANNLTNYSTSHKTPAELSAELFTMLKQASNNNIQQQTEPNIHTQPLPNTILQKQTSNYSINSTTPYQSQPLPTHSNHMNDNQLNHTAANESSGLLLYRPNVNQTTVQPQSSQSQYMLQQPIQPHQSQYTPPSNDSTQPFIQHLTPQHTASSALHTPTRQPINHPYAPTSNSNYVASSSTSTTQPFTSPYAFKLYANLYSAPSNTYNNSTTSAYSFEYNT